MDESILRIYQFSSLDVRSEPLIKLSFEKKFNIIVKMGMLTKEEEKLVKEFQKRRNELFHQGISIPNIDDLEREKIMDMGMLAVDAFHNLRERVNKKFGQSLCSPHN